MTGLSEVHAVAVDTELLLLVDVTKSVTPADFTNMMSAYADAFESSGVIFSLENGELGSIAASLVFYGDKNEQAVGLDWMQLSDETDAQSFAALLRGLDRPFDKKKQTSIAGALDFGVPLFGTETAGPENGFESTSQVIQITGNGEDDGSKKVKGSTTPTLESSRDAALASGVDIINALTVGAAGSVDAYFALHVVGGNLDGEPAVVMNSEDFASIGSVMQDQMLTVVPEPAASTSLLLGGLLMLGSRRRSPARRS